MYESRKSTCQEWTSKDDFENDKEDILVEKKEIFMKKQMENKEILRKKHKKQEVQTMKLNYERPLK